MNSWRLSHPRRPLLLARRRAGGLATTMYTATVEDARGAPVDRVTVVAMPADGSEEPVIKPDDADDKTMVHEVDLAVGANTITVAVSLSERRRRNVITTRTYTMNDHAHLSRRRLAEAR